jgi:hypothetical protein
MSYSRLTAHLLYGHVVCAPKSATAIACIDDARVAVGPVPQYKTHVNDFARWVCKGCDARDNAKRAQSARRLRYWVNSAARAIRCAERLRLPPF